MTIDFENKDEVELIKKWVYVDPENGLFIYKLKKDAPEKYKKVFDDLKERMISRKC